MKKPEGTNAAPEAKAPKKPYHAPVLRVHGTLVKLTAKGSAGTDLGAKHLP